jgi:flavin-dependent dehydrogenase
MDWGVTRGRGRVLQALQGPPPASSRLPLHDGDRIAVIGGGPAGSFFSFFLLRLATAVGLRLHVDVYEPRQFSHLGPGGCNHCGGVVSESLVQILAAEGISIPPSVIRSTIESYVIHMDVGSVKLRYLAEEGRIAALHRGNGPRGGNGAEDTSFDAHLLRLATEGGARRIPHLVKDIEYVDGLPAMITADGTRSAGYHLVAVAAGVNSNLVPIVRRSPEPGTTRTFICEFRADPEKIRALLGSSMHVFLLDLPRLEFAALVPKGENITLCMLGDDIDDKLIQDFLASPEVRRCLPEGVTTPVCNCSPLINIAGANPPFADRMVFIGDGGVTRLYKDGIGAAFKTAKAAADVAALVGVAQEDFRTGYLPICRSIEADNSIGKVIFGGSVVFKKLRFLRRSVFGLTVREQRKFTPDRPMSMVLWNLFTGSAPYRSILAQAFRPTFIGSLILQLVSANLFRQKPAEWKGDLS